MDVRELRELNKNAMRVFGEAVHQYPDVAQAVHLYFTQVVQCIVIEIKCIVDLYLVDICSIIF